MNNQHAISVRLIVKGETRQIAEAETIRRLSEWFAADADAPALYPNGTLLLWSIRDEAGTGEVSSNRSIAESKIAE